MLSAIATHVEFCQGTKGPLFRLTRTPQSVKAHLLFIAPLFEQANQTRHHVTRSAINGYHQEIETIIFDHYGTGDSAGELFEVDLVLWQQDIAEQILVIQNRSSKPIYLSVPLSAVLLLTEQILSQVKGLFLLQPELDGKRFTQQFKRLALVAQPHTKKQTKVDSLLQHPNIEIAGYQVQTQLLTDLAQQNFAQLLGFVGECYWFEWLGINDRLTAQKVQQLQALKHQCSRFKSHIVTDVKFWQSSSLTLSDDYLKCEQTLFTDLVMNSTLPFSQVTM